MRARYLIPLGIFAVLVVFFAVGLRLDPKLVPSPLIDKGVPRFDLPQVVAPGQQFSDAMFRQHKVSLFNVWASWCVSCRQEHPFLVQLSKAGRVPIYGLNYKDERADALRWLEVLGDPYTASAYDRDGRVGIDWGVYGVPETFVVDGNGVIRHKHVGPITPEVWQNELVPVIDRLEHDTAG